MSKLSDALVKVLARKNKGKATFDPSKIAKNPDKGLTNDEFLQAEAEQMAFDDEATNEAIEMLNKDRKIVSKPSKPAKTLTRKEIKKVDKQVPVAEKRAIVAQATNKPVEQVVAETTRKDGKEKKKGGLSDQFKAALTALAPSALGMLAGGIVGGTQGAVEGFEKGNALGEQLRKAGLDQQKVENSAQFADIQRGQLDIQQQRLGAQKLNLDLVDTRTGETLRTDFGGNVLNSKGEVVPNDFVKNLRVGREARLASQGDQRIANTQANTALRQASLENRISEQTDADRLKAVDTFNKDKQVVASREALTKAQGVKELVNSDSVFAPGAAVVAINRLAGNVGVLSDTDMALFGGSQAFKARIERFAKKSADGRLTETDRRDILQTINDLEKIHSGKINSIRDRVSSQIGKASSDVSEKEVREILTEDRKSSLKKKLFTR